MEVMKTEEKQQKNKFDKKKRKKGFTNFWREQNTCF